MKLTILNLLTIYLLAYGLCTQTTVVDPQYITVTSTPGSFCSVFTDDIAVMVNMKGFINSIQNNTTVSDVFGSTLNIELYLENIGFEGTGQTWSFEGASPIWGGPAFSFWLGATTPSDSDESWDFVLTKGNSNGFKYLFQNVKISIKITGASGAVYQVNTGINPTAINITIIDQSFEPDTGLSKGCLNLTLSHVCDNLADNGTIILEMDSFNSAAQPILNLFNSQVAPRCTGNVKANVQTPDVYCSVDGNKFFINNLFSSTTNISQIDLRICNIVTPPFSLSRNVTINLTASKFLAENPVYATGSFTVNNSDQQELRLIGSELANPFEGEPFDFTIEMQAFWGYVIEEKVFFVIRLPTQLSHVNKANFVITNNSNNTEIVFSQKRVRNRRAKLVIDLDSTNFLDLKKGFKIRVFGFDVVGPTGTYQIEYKLKVNSTKVKLMKDVFIDFDVISSSNESTRVIPFNKDFEAVSNQLVILELPSTLNLSSTQNYDIKLSFGQRLTITNGTFGGIDSVNGITLNTYTIDDTLNTLTMTDTVLTQIQSSNKVIFRLKGLRNNTINSKQNPVGMEVSDSNGVIYSATAQFDINEVVPEIQGVNVIQNQGQAELKVDFKYENINLGPVLMRLNLSNEFTVVFNTACVSDVNLWSPADIMNCTQGVSDSTDRQNLGISKTTLNTFPGTDHYYVQINVTLASEMLKQQSISLDFVREEPFNDLSITDSISSVSTFSFSLNCVANCIKCDTTASPIFTCTECESGYDLQPNGTCLQNNSNKMALIPAFMPHSQTDKKDNIFESKSNDDGMDDPWDSAVSFITKNQQLTVMLVSVVSTLLSAYLLDGSMISTLSSLILNYTFFTSVLETALSLPIQSISSIDEQTLLNIVIILFNNLVSLIFYVRLRKSIESYGLLHLLAVLVLPGHLFIISSKKDEKTKETVSRCLFLGNGLITLISLTFHITNQLTPIQPTKILYAFALLLTYTVSTGFQFKDHKKQEK